MSRETQLPKITSLVGLLSDIGICRTRDKAQRTPTLSSSALGKLHEAECLTHVDTKGALVLQEINSHLARNHS